MMSGLIHLGDRMFRIRCLIISIHLIFLVACSSPEEMALEYLNDGQTLLESGHLVKAELEFRNALQIDQKMVSAWYGLALIEESKANWEEMFRLLKRVVNLDPRHAQARVKMGRLMLGAGRLDEALEESNVAMELSPDDADVIALRAAVLYRIGDTEGAEELAEAALAVNPEQVDAIVVLATVRVAAGDTVRALVLLDQGIARDQSNIALQLYKIDVLTDIKLLDSAEEVYLRLIEMHPDNVELRHLFAQFYLEHGRQKDAEDVYREIVAVNPEDTEAKLNLVRFINASRGPSSAIVEIKRLVQLEPGNMEFLFILSQLYQSSNQSQLAKETIEKVIADSESTADRHRAIGQLAIYKMQEGLDSEVTALVNEVLAEDPRDEQALMIRASRFIENQKFDDAIADLRTVLKVSPDSASALLMLGRAHDLSGSPELADDVYASAFHVSRYLPEYGLPYAKYLLRIQRTESAVEVLQEALITQPNHLDSLTLLAKIRIGQGDWVQAQALVDRIAALEKAESISKQIQGAVYAGQQDYRRSIRAFKEAHQAAPSSTQPMFSLVQVYLRAGKEAEAMSFLQSVLAVNESNNDARLMMGQLFAIQGEEAKAEKVFNEVIERDPSNVVAYGDVARLNIGRNNLEKSMYVLDAGLVRNPGDFGLTILKASVLERQGDYEAAIGIYEGLLDERPGSDVVANNLASLLSDYRDDEDSFKRAHELAARFRDSDVPHFKDTLGWTYYRMGKAELAKELIEEAAREMPSLPIFRYHLGMAYVAIGEKKLALIELESALQLASDQHFPFRDEVVTTIEEL